MKKTDRPVFIDIDGTLTVNPGKQWGQVIKTRILAVQCLISDGQQVVLWSGGGTQYSRQFAALHGLSDAICIGKPEVVVDDNKDIRPRDRMPVLSPAEFFEDE